MSEKSLLATMTGEPFQPIRLHYEVLNRSALSGAFHKLRCLDYDPGRKRWVWLYMHEAKRLKFQNSYAQLPEVVHPVVIGSLFLRPSELLIDLRSCDRALRAIPFFDKHLPRRVVKVVEAEIVNRLFPATEANMTLSPDAIFDAQIRSKSDQNTMLRELVEKAKHGRDLEEKYKIVMEKLEADAREPLPEVERFPVHYAEDGIGGFETALRLRQVVALKHWSGDLEYTIGDAIRSSVEQL